MDKTLPEIKDPLILNERIFAVIGAWPLDKTYVKFSIIMTYYLMFIYFAYCDLFGVVNDIDELVANLIGTSVLTSTFLMMNLIRFNKIIGGVISTVRKEMASNIFDNEDEVQMYSNYNNLSRVTTKYVVIGAGFTGCMVYITPMLQIIRLLAVEGNIGTEYSIPFRLKAPFDISQFRTYILFYLFLFPLTYVALLHINTAAVLCNLVLHVCGRLAILSYRIRSISTKDEHQFNTIIKALVKLHLQIQRTGRSIDDVFNLILLLALGESSFRLGLSMYTLLRISDDADVTKIVTYATYVIVMTLLLFALCFIGEQLVHECRNLQDSYYYCDWEEIPYTCRKSLLICMINGQKMLQITAGRFYVFSLYGFTGIMKTSMAYVSMLKAML